MLEFEERVSLLKESMCQEYGEWTHMSPFKEPCLVIIDPRMLGTHEETSDDALKTVDFSKGWNGKPIAIAEYGGDNLYYSLGAGIHDLSGCEDLGVLGVLDGHHRREMGIKGEMSVVAEILPFNTDTKVVVGSWNGCDPIGKSELLEYFLYPDRHVAPKTTKMMIECLDGLIRRIADVQKTIRLPREMLVT